jgi:hypothetical protein
LTLDALAAVETRLDLYVYNMSPLIDELLAVVASRKATPGPRLPWAIR